MFKERMSEQHVLAVYWVCLELKWFINILIINLFIALGDAGCWVGDESLTLY